MKLVIIVNKSKTKTTLKVGTLLEETTKSWYIETNGIKKRYNKITPNYSVHESINSVRSLYGNEICDKFLGENKVTFYRKMSEIIDFINLHVDKINSNFSNASANVALNYAKNMIFYKNLYSLNTDNEVKFINEINNLINENDATNNNK